MSNNILERPNLVVTTYAGPLGTRLQITTPGAGNGDFITLSRANAARLAVCLARYFGPSELEGVALRMEDEGEW